MIRKQNITYFINTFHYMRLSSSARNKRQGESLFINSFHEKNDVLKTEKRRLGYDGENLWK